MQPVFITIDPERDSVAQIKSFLEEFHPRLIGLTGPLEKVSCCSFILIKTTIAQVLASFVLGQLPA